MNFFELWFQKYNLITNELIFSTLIGLFQYPVNIETTTSSISIPIFHPQINSPIGNILLNLSFQPTEDIAKKWLTKSLTDESIRSLLREIPSNVEKSGIKNSFVSQEIQSDSKSLNNIEIIPNLIKQIDNYSQTEEIDIIHENKPDNCLVDNSESNIAPPKFSFEPNILYQSKNNNLSKSNNSNTTNQLESQSESQSRFVQFSLDSLENSTNFKYNIPENKDNQTFSIDSIQDLGILNSNSPNTSQNIENTLIDHTIELSIEGNLDPIFHRHDSLGCFVCYNFPNLQDDNVN